METHPGRAGEDLSLLCLPGALPSPQGLLLEFHSPPQAWELGECHSQPLPTAECIPLQDFLELLGEENISRCHWTKHRGTKRNQKQKMQVDQRRDLPTEVLSLQISYTADPDALSGFFCPFLSPPVGLPVTVISWTHCPPWKCGNI